MSKQTAIGPRVACPCCGYPTLTERAAYEICELCNWEDDGQDEENEDEVVGGPNADYSLTEARSNFRLNRVMYAPGRDQRIVVGDSVTEFEAKGDLMKAFDRLAWLSSAKAQPEEAQSIVAEILRLEALLQSETNRQVLEYEKLHRGDD